MYSIIRKDILLAPGEMTAHAIHAALHTFGESPDPSRDEHLKDGHGNVIVLSARNEGVLHAAYARARDLDIPCHLWFDSDRPGDGAIALGLGPVFDDTHTEITKKFQLM